MPPWPSSTPQRQTTHVETLRRLTCAYVTGDVSPEELPMIAAEAIVRGVDSPSLRQLAGLGRRDDTRDIRDLYRAAMDELGIDIPDADALRWEYVHFWAQRMLDGSLSPYEAASKISTESFRLGEPEALRDLYILTLLWEDDPGHRTALERSMLEAAENLHHKR
jgi:hypothetical protein